uniref:C-type lectin domain-containing protein n=1 Tax=Biomphalaria glabrata TaxID=6526 RepID=A0A182YTL0_BIOGL
MTMFLPGQPDNLNNADCVVILSQSLYSQSTKYCDLALGYNSTIMRTFGLCLKIVRANVNFSLAKLSCSKIQGRLAMVKSNATKESLLTIMQGMNIEGAWVGIDDIQSEGTYVWSDGSVLTPEEKILYIPKQPDNLNNSQDCTTERERESERQRERERQCSVKKLCLGGADLGSAGIKPSSRDRLYSQSTQYCDVSLGYNSTIMRTHGLCLFISTSRTTFSSANSSCASMQGQLVMIKTSAKNITMLKIMQELNVVRAWVGLNDRLTEGTYVWSDGSLASPTDMKLFIYKQPDNAGDSDCVIILQNYAGGADLGSAGIKPLTGQRLYSQSTKYCDVSLGYNSTIMRTYGLCLSISKPALNFSAANLSCRSRHGRLVITKTNATYDSLLRIMQDMSIDWVWVGLDDGQTEGTYVWSDGTVATKSEMLFLAGQPDNLYNSDCIALSRIYLGLDDVGCSGQRLYSQSTKYCDVALGYNSTIMRTFGLCLKIVRANVSFSLAELSCSNIQGRLVMVKSNVTKESLLTIMQDMNIEKAWVGIDDILSEGTYVWSDGSEVTPEEKTVFIAGQPDDLYNSQDCT